MTQRLSKNKSVARSRKVPGFPARRGAARRRVFSVLLAALVCMATLTLGPPAAYAAFPVAQPIPVSGVIDTPGLYDISIAPPVWWWT